MQNQFKLDLVGGTDTETDYSLNNPLCVFTSAVRYEIFVFINACLILKDYRVAALI